MSLAIDMHNKNASITGAASDLGQTIAHAKQA